MGSAVRRRLQATAAFLLFSAAIAHGQDAVVNLPTPNEQPIAGPSVILRPTMMAGDYQSLRPISYFPGLLDQSPFKLLANQTFGYNDNVFMIPKGAPLPAGATRGDSFSTTTVGATASAFAGAQRFFVDGIYGFTRYAHDTSYNSENYALNAGWDWVFTSRCSGRLVASDSQVQAPINLINSFNVNNIKTVAFNETAKCNVGERINLIGDSGVSRITNSLATSSANNANVNFLRGGIEYDFSELNTIGFKTTLSKYDYFDRSPVLTPGLATSLNLTEYAFYLRRLFSPKLELFASIGFTDISSTSAISSSDTTVSTWALSLRWIATPKISILATTSQTVSPPQDIVADYQRTRLNSLTAVYLFSPKLTFSGSIGVAQTDSPTVSGVNQALLLVNQTTRFATLGAIYQITPLLNATANYSYNNRKDDTTGLVATSNIFLLGLNYQR